MSRWLLHVDNASGIWYVIAHQNLKHQMEDKNISLDL